MSDLAEGRAASFDEIAQRENKVERHIRYLAPLAFVSPRIIEAIANGNAPADLTVTTLARALCECDCVESRLRKSEQGDKWSFCLTAGKMSPRIRRTNERTSTPEPHTVFHGEGGACHVGGEKTLSELAQLFDVHPNQITQ